MGRALRRIARAAWLVGLWLAIPGPASAQTVSSTLAGVVHGDDGTPAPGAIVEARSEETGTVRSAVSGRDGRYRIDLLAPGVWTVSARLGDGPPGTARTVTLRLQETLGVDLTIGSAMTETVTVRGEAPLVDPARTGEELRIDQRQVSDLPIAGRVAIDLALLDASVKSAAPGNFFGERGSVFVVNGQSGRANSFLVDGLDNNDRISGTTLNSYFSQEVIKEFVVLTNQYAPEFGRASGGVLNIITRQGSNEPRAEGFAQGIFSSLNDAGDFVDSLPRPDGLQRTSTGFKAGLGLGGPINPDHSFYFASYEHQETDAVTPYTGVTRDGVRGGWMVAPDRDDNLFVRTDYNLGASSRLMLRLSGDDRSTSGLDVGGVATPETGFKVDERDLQLAASLTTVLSPALLNEARFLAATSSFDQLANSDRPGVDRPSGSFGGNNLNRQLRDEDTFQLVDNFTWQIGRHSVKLGADVARTRTGIRTRFNPNGNFLYETDRPFEPGDCGDLDISMVDPNDKWKPIPCPGQVGVDDDGDGVIDEPGIIGTYPVVFQLIEGAPTATLRDTRLALFAQDTWEAGPRLLLNYGLRYDLSTFRLPADARVPSTILNGGAGPDRNDIAPRIGFTFRPGGVGSGAGGAGRRGRWLLRGGAGIFYDKLVLGFPAVAAITSGTRIGLLFPQGLAFEITENVVEQYGIDAIKPGLIFPDSLTLRFSTGTRLDTPYTEQASLGVERAAGARGSFSADVTRAQGYHQTLLRDLNPVVATDPYGLPIHRDPNTGSIAAFVTEGRSWYTGLDLRWRWRGERSWYSASYTLSRAIDLGPDPLKGGIALPPNSDDIAGEKGRSDSDRRHRLVIAGAMALPWKGLMASGVLSAASGAPFDITTGTDDNLDGVTSDRPPGVRRNTGASTSLSLVNSLRAADGLPPVERLSEPSFFQVDLRVSKPFLFGQGNGNGEAFLQVFNLLDRLNPGPIEGRANARDFGRPLGQVGPPRTVEIGLRIGF